MAQLEILDQKIPGHYRVAADLGTAYELIGENENALHWVTASINQTPDGLDGTEWLHQLMLETKIQAAHPNQLLPPRLITVPERLTSDTPISVRAGKTYPAQEVHTAIVIQLQERMGFVNPKDPYVADLLYTCALIKANLSTVESALELLTMARKYGFPDEILLARQEARFQAAITKGHLSTYAKVALAWLGLGLVLYFAHRKKLYFLTRRAALADRTALAEAKADRQARNLS